MEVGTASNYRPKKKPASYKDIVAYVEEKYDVRIHEVFIAQVKRQCGLKVGECHYKAKKYNPYRVYCPPDKAEYIKDALRHFGILQDEEG